MGTVDNAAATITTKKTMISILADKSNNILPNKYSTSITLAARNILKYFQAYAFRLSESAFWAVSKSGP